MSLRPALRAPFLALLPAMLIAGCAGDPGTAPNGPDYSNGKPRNSTSLTLTNLVLTPTTLTVGEDNTADYTVTITNGKARQSDIGLQGYVVQVRPSDGVTADHGAGGTGVTCTAVFGEVLHGTCSTGFSINVFNRDDTGPALESGAATFHLELIDGSGAVLASIDAPVTLVVP